MWLIPVLLTLIAGYTLAAAAINSRYDSRENRSPIRRIASAAVAFTAALGALAATRRAQHRTRQSHPDVPRLFIALTALAVVLILFSWIFIEITGPT